jgi:hypothetical protein
MWIAISDSRYFVRFIVLELNGCLRFNCLNYDICRCCHISSYGFDSLRVHDVQYNFNIEIYFRHFLSCSANHTITVHPSGVVLVCILSTTVPPANSALTDSVMDSSRWWAKASTMKGQALDLDFERAEGAFDAVFA